MRLLFVSCLTLSLISPVNSVFAQDKSQPTANAPIIHQIYQLVDQRNPNSPLFQQALDSKDVELQKSALLGLARIGGKTIIPVVTPYLDHENEALRQHAALALGISGDKSAAYYLWQRLEKEISLSVKKEIYLGLGNLGQNRLISRMMDRLEKEKDAVAQAYLFQGLAIALTFHRDLIDDYEKIDFAKLLSRFSKGDKNNAMVGFFINRIPKVENYINASDLLKLTQSKLSDESKINLARVASKVTKNQHEDNRKLLAWIIEQSNSGNLAVQLEAIRAMRNLTDVPQSLIQLGKYTKAPNPIVAQTALATLASSDLKSDEVIKLFKNQLKNESDAMVVEAIKGLVKRQEKDDMSWVVQLFRHPSSYVKISLISQLKAKSETDFNNLVKFFTNDTNKEVAAYAKTQLEAQPEQNDTPAESPGFSEIKTATNKKVALNTTHGKIVIQLLEGAPYTTWHFIRNAKEGSFNNSYFSRVIGNFVAQGGDTIGDLQGASDKTIREEISLLSHEPMTVGMATAGKDTGSSQFFINTGRNYHLDRNYTVFGKVIEGQEIVMRMANGVKVLNVKVF